VLGGTLHCHDSPFRKDAVVYMGYNPEIKPKKHTYLITSKAPLEVLKSSAPFRETQSLHFDASKMQLTCFCWAVTASILPAGQKVVIRRTWASLCSREPLSSKA